MGEVTAGYVESGGRMLCWLHLWGYYFTNRIILSFSALDCSMSVRAAKMVCHLAHPWLSAAAAPTYGGGTTCTYNRQWDHSFAYSLACSLAASVLTMPDQVTPQLRRLLGASCGPPATKLSTSQIYQQMLSRHAAIEYQVIIF